LHMQQLLTASFDRAGSNSELLVAEKRSPAPAAKQTVAVATPVRAPAPTLAPLPEVETVVVSLDAKEMPAITREWAIQIGAFGASKTAMGAAQQAVTTAAAFLDDGEVKVVPLKMRDGKTLHRGRIIGLTKDQAEGACKVLKKAQSTCMELRLKDDSVQTAATSR
jgi:hypothetical protein